MKKIFVLIIIVVILFLNSSKALEIDEIIVDIKGAVKLPGTYTIKYGSRVSDLISVAGGLLENADTSLINLSKRLMDEDVLTIYTVSEVLEMRKGNTSVKVIDISLALIIRPLSYVALTMLLHFDDDIKLL